MRRIVLFAALAVCLQATPAAAQSDGWAFKTPGGAAYCRLDLCMRPSDGFFLRFTGVFGDHPDVRKGFSDRFRGFDGPAARVLGFGQVFYSSDAEVITCWSRRSGVTCKHFEGLSFSLGRDSGHRIFYDAPGSPPNVHPLFRSHHGIFCGISAENLEPSNPYLDCWRPADGVRLGVAHDNEGRRGFHSSWEKALGFRPPGFRRVASAATFVWRCRDVTAAFAERCSTRAGEPVFTCTSTRARLTCRNRPGQGFWVSARSFYTF